MGDYMKKIIAWIKETLKDKKRLVTTIHTKAYDWNVEHDGTYGVVGCTIVSAGYNCNNERTVNWHNKIMHAWQFLTFPEFEQTSHYYDIYQPWINGAIGDEELCNLINSKPQLSQTFLLR